MKKLFILMSIALMGLTGCTEEVSYQNNTDMDYLQDVYIKFENAAQPDTRADEPSKGNTDKASFASGYIFFLTNINASTNIDTDTKVRIKKCYRITPSGGTATDLSNHIINLSDFWDSASKTGYPFSNVSGEVKGVYIVGNIPDTGNTTEANIRSITTLKELREVVIPMSAQSAVGTVSMDGTAKTLTDVSASHDGTAMKATVDLQPLCSRIEIAKLTAGGKVTAYRVQGIYVSHFYSEMPWNETAVAGKQVLYDATTESATYTTYSFMCDKATSTTTTLGKQTGSAPAIATAPATANNVWAYQFLAGNNSGRIPPRVVIKLNGVTSSITGAFDSSAFYYLNIRGFKTTTGNSDPMAVTRGKIYKISDIPFKENDISDIPNPNDVSLTVTATVKNWVVENVYPVM